MSERLTGIDLGPPPGPPRRPSRYPLDEWMDGATWRIWRGEDYDGPIRSMRAWLHHYASSNGLKVRTRAVFEGGREGLLFQFRLPGHGGPGGEVGGHADD